MQWMKQFFTKYPSVRNGLLIGLLLSASDTVAQLAFEDKFDWRRNAEFLVLGLGWLAPSIELWYGKLLPKITARYLSHLSKPKAVAARVLIDNLIFPPLAYAGFYTIKYAFFSKDKEETTYE